jgi:hypothetical protein
LALREKIEQCLPDKNPLKPPDYIEAEVQAIWACWDGRATDRQQRMVLDWVVRAAGTYDMSFRPENQYLTAFAEGRRHVGTTLVWMLKSAPTRTDPDKIASRELKDDPNGRADNR